MSLIIFFIVFFVWAKLEPEYRGTKISARWQLFYFRMIDDYENLQIGPGHVTIVHAHADDAPK